MNHLLRSHAPISDKGWELLDSEAKERLSAALAARRLVDFSGPYGWERSSSNIGRSETVQEAICEGVSARRRRVLPLIELRSDFTVSRDELRDADRGAPDPDLESLDRATRQIALAENVAVFHGFEAAGMAGVAEASPHPPITLSDDYDDYPGNVAKAVELLLEVGVDGPYGLALGPDGYTGVIESTEHGGYLVFDHLRKILDGPVVYAPGVRGAVVLSLRGGDFLFESGQDLSIGYDHHDSESVHLYLEESFSFFVATPDAAVSLTAA
jgi:uncharacterized linocin/CFP29 family protein